MRVQPVFILTLFYFLLIYHLLDPFELSGVEVLQDIVLKVFGYFNHVFKLEAIVLLLAEDVLDHF